MPIVSGVVFRDFSGDGLYQVEEALYDARVWIDLRGDGVYNPATSITTDLTGAFAFDIPWYEDPLPAGMTEISLITSHLVFL